MKSRTIIEAGELRYEIVPEWAVLPSGLPALPIAGVACAADGYLYAISRNHEHPVVEFDPEGRYVRTLAKELNFKSEHGITVSPDNCLWVGDSGRHVIYKLTRDGEVVKSLGTKDTPCDNGFRPEIPYPHNLYTVQRAGEPFNLPTGAFETEDGNVFCTDGYGNASVHVFDANGELIRTFGGPGDAPDRFRLPHSVWLDRQGLVWIADRDNYRVKVFQADGTPVRCFDPIYPKGTMYGPSTLWGDDTRVYAGENSVGILVFDQKTCSLEAVLEAPTGSPILGHSICGDSSGNLYVGHLNPVPMITKLVRM